MTDKAHTTWMQLSDEALVQTIGNFVKHHRLEQNRTQDDVAKAAGVSRSTLSLLERGETVTIRTLIQVLRVLDVLYIMNSFNVTKQISPIEAAKLEKKNRQRASGNASETTWKKTDW